MTKINIYRTKGFNDGFRNYEIILNEELIETIEADKTETFDVKVGTHKLKLKIDWCGSEEVEFNIKKNETISFVCGNNINILNGIFIVLFMHQKYLWLRKI